MSTTNNPSQFAFLSRILHWLMAALLAAMLFIGVSMVAKLGDYHWLLALHRPLGIVILILAVIRLVTRLLTRAPALPADMSQMERLVIKMSEYVLYIVVHRAAAGRLGDAVGGPLPDRDVRIGACASYSAREAGTICYAA